MKLATIVRATVFVFVSFLGTTIASNLRFGLSNQIEDAMDAAEENSVWKNRELASMSMFQSLSTKDTKRTYVIAGNQEPLSVNVKTTEGALKGRYDPSLDINVFKSIPYALPPLGNNSFSPPKQPQMYSGEYYDASGFTPKACMQPKLESSIPLPAFMSEDCLYLDIFTPSKASSDPEGYPVLVWIHGGGMFTGSKEVFNVSYIATNMVVTVAINYRLGAWGFLRVKDDTPGNYGFLDQVEALKWIKHNIAAFGGNPNLVTIQGQSAGARSVGYHLVSPLSKDFFHRAFVMSGPIHQHHTNETDAIATATAFSALLGCDLYDLACIRGKRSEKVLQAEYMYMDLCYCMTNVCGLTNYSYRLDKGGSLCGLQAEVGNDAVPQVFDAFKKGDVNIVPIMIGSAWNEGLQDSSMQYNPLLRNAAWYYGTNQTILTENLYKQFLNQIVDHMSYENDVMSYLNLYSDRAKRLYETYPYDSNDPGFQEMYPFGYNGNTALEKPLDASYVYFAMFNDKEYLCPFISIISAMQEALGSSSPAVFMYRFAQQLQYFQSMYESDFNGDPTTAVQNEFFSWNLYATHGWDIPFWHDDKSYGKAGEGTAFDRKMVQRMVSYAVNFIYTGDPNKGPMNETTGTIWKEFDHELKNLILLSEPEENPEVKNPRESQCAYWDEMNFEY